MTDKVLITEISGKRPGTSKERPTEKFPTKYPFVIISNNSDGYETDKPIINVPDDYRQWYIENIKSSDNAWYAPMNRSYAIKYAKEHGYRYLVQLDDNIVFLEISMMRRIDNIIKRYRARKPEMLDDFIDMFLTVLQNTNAGMVGCQLTGSAVPEWEFLRERYCYSIFMLDLERCPDTFQGDFEDDIEFRLKLKQMGVPVVQITPFKYSKTGRGKNNTDLSGCRAEYMKAGLKRGEHMSKLYGDMYSCCMVNKKPSVKALDDGAPINFKHILKPFKIGVIVSDMDLIKNKFENIVVKYSAENVDRVLERTKKVKKK